MTGYRLFRSRRAIIVSIIYALACLNGGLKPNRNVEWAGKAVGTTVRADYQKSLAYMITEIFFSAFFQTGNIRNGFIVVKAIMQKGLLVIQRA